MIVVDADGHVEEDLAWIVARLPERFRPLDRRELRADPTILDE